MESSEQKGANISETCKRPFAANHSRGRKLPCWRAKVTLGHGKQMTYMIVNGYFLCLSCPSASEVLSSTVVLYHVNGQLQRVYLPHNTSFWQVGLLDVALSQYPAKSHNFTNLIFYDVTLQNSIAVHTIPDSVLCWYKSYPVQCEQRFSNTALTLLSNITSCITVKFRK